MALATIKLVNEKFMSEFYFKKDLAALAQQLLIDDQYRVQGVMAVANLEGENVAEAIDFTVGTSADHSAFE